MLTFLMGFLVGTFLGSLILCLSDRAVTNKTFLGRSYCDKCKTPLAPFDLIPIFSYLFLKGKCRNCRVKLSVWYPLSEILIGFLIGFLFWQSLPGGFIPSDWINGLLLYSNLVFGIFIISVLSIVLITDLKTGLIPDRITFPAVMITFLYLVVITIFKIYLVYEGLKQSEIGKYLLPPYSDYFYRHSQIVAEPLTFGVAAALLLGFFFGTLILVTQGRGMGGGDLKLSIFIGLFLALPLSIVSIMLAFLLGSVCGIGLILFGKKKFGQTIPFGPFMSLGAIITLFWGQHIMNWYLSLKFI